jgi:hypothetical protein
MMDSTRRIWRKGVWIGAALIGVLSLSVGVDAVGSAAHTAPAFTAYHAFGDSITASFPGTTGAPYPQEIARAKGLPVSNYAVAGFTSAQMNDVELFPNVTPSTSSPVVNTIMIGTNDVDIKGLGSWENVYTANVGAAASFLAIPDSSKVNPATCPNTGSWTPHVNAGGYRGANPFYPANPSMSENGAGGTITCSMVVRNGVLYAWVNGYAATGITYTYSIDGGAPVSGATAVNDNGVDLIRVTGLSNVSHSFELTVMSAGGFNFGGIGTPPASGACCAVLLSGVPYQLGDATSTGSNTLADTTGATSLRFVSTPAHICVPGAACAAVVDYTTPAALNSQVSSVTSRTTKISGSVTSPGVSAGDTIDFGNSIITAAYNTHAQTVASELAADGLNVRFMNIRAYCNSTTDMGPSLIHPNQAGVDQIAVGFETIWPFSASARVTRKSSRR